MAVSKVRKKRPSKVAAKPATLRPVRPVGPLPAPQELMEQLLVDTARVFQQRTQLFEQMAHDFPTLTGLEDARLKMQVASLALVDAIDATAGRPMTYETMRAEHSA